MGIFDVPSAELISIMKDDLKVKKLVNEPAFTVYAKTGNHRMRAPSQQDWFYMRCASILYRVYKDGPVGTESLRNYYGGRKARGSKPEHFVKASGKVIRSCLQELEKAGFLAKHKDKEGRIVTPTGQKYLNEQSRITLQKLPEIYQMRKEAAIERKKKLASREGSQVRQELSKQGKQGEKKEKQEKGAKEKAKDKAKEDKKE